MPANLPSVRCCKMQSVVTSRSRTVAATNSYRYRYGRSIPPFSRSPPNAGRVRESRWGNGLRLRQEKSGMLHAVLLRVPLDA